MEKYYQNSIVRQILDQIFDQTNSIITNKFLKEYAKIVVSKDFINNQIQSVMQFYPNIKANQENKIDNDRMPNQKLKQHCRPYSSKIKIEKIVKQKKIQKIVNLKKVSRYLKNISNQKVKNQPLKKKIYQNYSTGCLTKTNDNKSSLKRLIIQAQIDNSFINQLRENKFKQENRLIQFFQIIKSETKKFHKTQKNVINQFENSNFTYSNYQNSRYILDKRTKTFRKFKKEKIYQKSDIDERPTTAQTVFINYKISDGIKHTIPKRINPYENKIEQMSHTFPSSPMKIKK